MSTTPVTIFHGGDDFDEVSPQKFGSGEPGNIRPLGQGLHGGLAVHPQDTESAIELARIYSKYARKTPMIHAFQADLPDKIGNLNYGNSPPGWARTGVTGSWQAEALPWTHKTGAPTAKEISVQNPAMLTRVGKWPADTPSAQIMSDLSNRTPKAEGGGFHVRRQFHVPRVRLHVGAIHSPVAGRTDHLPLHVPSGSYVVPADVVSAHGEGNTLAAFKVMRRTFGGLPYGAGQSGPYGQGSGPYGEPLQNHAKGGKADHHDEDEGVPIVAAGGEYVLSPDEVRKVGEGDIDLGHKVMDEWVVRSRKQLIKTLQKLPGPKRS